jgi:hypothetical protein
VTGVYGSGKSSVAEEIAYLLEQRGEPYALLDLDYLSWAGTGTGGRAEEFELLLQNLTAVMANYQRAGVRLFVSPTLSRLLCPQLWRGGRRAKGAGAADAGGAPDRSVVRYRAAAGG